MQDLTPQFFDLAVGCKIMATLAEGGGGAIGEPRAMRALLSVREVRDEAALVGMIHDAQLQTRPRSGAGFFNPHGSLQTASYFAISISSISFRSRSLTSVEKSTPLAMARAARLD